MEQDWMLTCHGDQLPEVIAVQGVIKHKILANIASDYQEAIIRLEIPRGGG